MRATAPSAKPTNTASSLSALRRSSRGPRAPNPFSRSKKWALTSVRPPWLRTSGPVRGRSRSTPSTRPLATFSAHMTSPPSPPLTPTSPPVQPKPDPNPAQCSLPTLQRTTTTPPSAPSATLNGAPRTNSSSTASPPTDFSTTWCATWSGLLSRPAHTASCPTPSPPCSPPATAPPPVPPRPHPASSSSRSNIPTWNLVPTLYLTQNDRHRSTSHRAPRRHPGGPSRVPLAAYPSAATPPVAVGNPAHPRSAFR